MKLEYVGPKPVVSQHGVNFDKSEPDRYIFLHAAIELLEVIEECVNAKSCYIEEQNKIDLTNWEGIQYSQAQLLDLVKKHCSDNLENIIEKREQKVSRLIEELKADVNANENLSEDDKIAWIGNIDIMSGYYKQYVENEIAYECLLDVLADDIYKRKLKEISFNLGKNYGFLFSYLQDVLSNHKPPIDCELKVEALDSKAVGRFLIKHPKKLSF
jgi:hypothetical protein